MKIEMHEIPVSEVVAGYLDSQDNGVVGYHGRLDIRPAFQREFIYKEAQRDEVIRTIRKGFPLNVMYWSVAGKNADGETLTIREADLISKELNLSRDEVNDIFLVSLSHK